MKFIIAGALFLFAMAGLRYAHYLMKKEKETRLPQLVVEESEKHECKGQVCMECGHQNDGFMNC